MLSTHVLDTSTGRPGAGIGVTLLAVDGAARTRLAALETNADGRTDRPLAETLTPGVYELVFRVGPYFASRGVASFYDEIAIRVRIEDANGKYHVPLLLAPWGYSTYRGS